jgi:hypothetical protein
MTVIITWRIDPETFIGLSDERMVLQGVESAAENYDVARKIHKCSERSFVEFSGCYTFAGEVMEDVVQAVRDSGKTGTKYDLDTIKGLSYLIGDQSVKNTRDYRQSKVGDYYGVDISSLNFVGSKIDAETRSIIWGKIGENDEGIFTEFTLSGFDKEGGEGKIYYVPFISRPRRINYNFEALGGAGQIARMVVGKYLHELDGKERKRVELKNGMDVMLTAYDYTKMINTIGSSIELVYYHMGDDIRFVEGQEANAVFKAWKLGKNKMMKKNDVNGVFSDIMAEGAAWSDISAGLMKKVDNKRIFDRYFINNRY